MTTATMATTTAAYQIEPMNGSASVRGGLLEDSLSSFRSFSFIVNNRIDSCKEQINSSEINLFEHCIWFIIKTAFVSNNIIVKNNKRTND